MNSPVSPGPAPLYDKPHSVDLAQVMMVFQYFMLVSVSLGLGPRLLGWVEDQSHDIPGVDELEAALPVGTTFPIAVVLPLIAVLTVPYAVIVYQLGNGRRWTRVFAVLFATANTAIGIAGVSRTYGDVTALVISPIWIAMALCVIGGLASRTGRLWFRQGGWTPWYLRYELDQLDRRRALRRPRPRRRPLAAAEEDSGD
ncbi:hypothetical protein [Glycomyces terrestris]|uniref:Uncharacterized protein n=1 Tax=Glycomyces terrestris TaxID=2493553 RepID=A0A426UZX5_9ACTN|nr:hypothetical protein [Glycomyces terrestris]RRS00156.1 hypothetical protein EIW28_06060 [Glycomyces terrestris]